MPGQPLVPVLVDDDGAVVAGDARRGGLRFRLRDVEGTAAVPVVYKGSVPDLFKSGRDISLRGELKNGTFVGQPGTLVTKCPSKYSDKKPA